MVASVNVQDTKLLPDSLNALSNIAVKLKINLKEIPITFDSGFYSQINDEIIYKLGMIPVIKPNHRKTKNFAIIAAREDFFKELEPLYKQRHSIERTFAWEDVYRKLVIRYERLQSTFLGFRYLAYTMINYRSEFGKT
mgnify:FL=1